jgi:tryptophan halogenase
LPEPARGAVLARQCRSGVDPGALARAARQWRYRPPGRFDFLLDLESFAFFNYQYILYGMEYRTDLSPVREEFPECRGSGEIFARDPDISASARRRICRRTAR